jgi:ATP-binding cassette subfamily F protein 3
MIQFSAVSKAFAGKSLLQDVTFSLSRGERVALVGRNGCGKSTVLKMIIGEEQPDQGNISIPRGYRCGHLAQHLSFREENIVHEACLGLPPDERDQHYRAEILLSGLGFTEDDMLLPAERFSGGFQIRINLARVLLSAPNLLLLDEPTNYLDIVSARWLTRFLREWKNEMILISHDRDFLNDVSTHTMLIHRSGVRKIAGGTSKLYEQIATEEEVYEKTRVNEDKKRRETEIFINRFRAKATKAAAVQSRIKALERMGTKEALTDEESLDFSFTETVPFYGKFLLEARSLTFAYPAAAGAAPSTPLVRDFSLNIGKNDRIGVIGKNGKGKSTLLRLLAGELQPNAGEIALNANTKIGFFGQTNIARLSPRCSIEEEIAAVNPQLSRTRVRSICGTMMFSGDQALKQISVLSGGERSRVLLGKILAQPTNLLFLDEPTNHLDMESIEALLESAQQYQGAMVIVTHSEHILRALATRLVVFQDQGPQLLEGNYDYFLEKLGWGDEEQDQPSARKKSPAVSVAPQDSAAQAKRVKELEKLEKKIYSLEEKIARWNAELVQASERQDAKTIAELGRSIAEAQREIEVRFEELEQL